MDTFPIQELSAPFPADMVKQRKGNFGQQLSYIEANAVIQKLNDCLKGQWSFEVVNVRIETDEVIVQGKLTIGTTVREQFGGSRITRHRESGDPICIADDTKSAASDCLKKCASMAGVGLHLYHDGNSNGTSNNHRATSSARNRNGYHKPENGNGDHSRISNKMIADIFHIAKDAGIQQKDVIQWARESFSTTISGLTPAQGDELIAMITAQAA